MSHLWSIRHQIVVLAQGVLNVECRASRRISIGSASRHHARDGFLATGAETPVEIPRVLMTALRWVQGAKPFGSVGAHNHCMRICGPACSKHAKIIYLCCQSALSTSVYQNPPASLPAGLSDGLPIGMPIIGRRNADVHVLAASAAFERLRPWHDNHRVRRGRSLRV
jgi:hypothetical protein